jgi:hypothetical protein
MKKIGILSIVILFIVGGFFYSYRIQIRDFVLEFTKEDLPEPTRQGWGEAIIEDSSGASSAESIAGEGATANTPEHKEDAQELPNEINLAVPFTPQAPHANWEMPYQEACEEASILMAAYYKLGKTIDSPEDADREILKLVEFQNDYFGYYEDTTAEETAELAREYYGFGDARIIHNPTVDDIKAELADGNPVIVPAAGRQLGNPNFRGEGPLYHMLVIRGYTEDKFITNDPGTRNGEEFVYDYDVLMNAMHDWNGGEVDTGQKVVIVLN